MKIRLESVSHRYHEDHIAAKGVKSLSHENGMGKIRENTGMAADRSQERNKGRKVHFASLMDHCHLKNSETQPQDQEYKSRVVLRCDIAKDESGSYAVFTEKRIVRITNDSCTIRGYHLQIAKLCKTSSRRSLYPGANGGCTQIVENPTIGMSRHLESVRSSSGRTVLEKAFGENPIAARLGENSNLGMSLCTS